MKHSRRRLLALALAFAMAATMAPVTTAQAASKKTVTVSTQAQLTKALKTKGVSKIIVKTTKAVKFTVEKGKYSAKLEVNAPKATMNNSGTWSAVTVADAKYYTEKAKNNKILVKDKKLTFTVAKDASVKSVTFAKKGASDTVKINGKVSAITISAPSTVSITDNGSIKKVTVDAKSKVTLSGSSEDQIAVTLTKNAESSIVKSAVPVAVKSSANAAITFKEGAEGSTVAVKTADAKITMTNSTTAEIQVTNPDGKKEAVASGEKLSTGSSDIGTDKEDEKKDEDKKDEEKKEDEKKPEAGGGGGGTSSGGTSTPDTPVTPSNVAVTDISANGTPVSVKIGESKTLSYTISPSNATNQTVTWSTSDSSKVTVENGIITGVAAGSATITATTADGGFSCAWVVTVTPDPTEITISDAPVTIYVGDQFTLWATVAPEGADQGVTWTSSDEMKAMVSNNGMVTAVSSGAVTITATSAVKTNVSGTKEITITEKPEGAKTVTFKVDGAVYRTVTYTDDDTTFATVKPANPAKTGYTFDGWKLNGEGAILTDDAAVESDAVYYAIFTVEKYTVTYDTKGGDTIEAATDVAYNSEHTLAGATTKEGYTFLGWATKSDSTVKEYSAGAKYTVTKDITFYAVWKVNTYTITLKDSTTNAGKITYEAVSASSGTISNDYDADAKVTVNFSITEGYYLSALNVKVGNRAEVNAMNDPSAFDFTFTDESRTGSVSIPRTDDVVITPVVSKVAEPSISVAASSVICFEGESNKTISITDQTAESGKGTITYQWYQAASADGEGTVVSGAISATYTLPSPTLDNVETLGCIQPVYYYCIATNTISGSAVIKKSDVITVNNAVRQVNDLSSLSNASGQYVLIANCNVTEDTTIPEDVTLYIPAGVTLTISNNAILTENGTIVTLAASVATLSSAAKSGARLMNNTLRSLEDSAGKIVIDSEGNAGYARPQGYIQTSGTTELRFTSFYDLQSKSQQGLVVTPEMSLYVGKDQYFGGDAAKISITGNVGWFTNGDGNLCLCILGSTTATVKEQVDCGLIIVKGTDGCSATFNLGSWEYFGNNTKLCIENGATLKVGNKLIVSPSNDSQPIFHNATNDPGNNEKGLLFSKGTDSKIEVNYCHSDAGTSDKPQKVTINKDNTVDSNGVVFNWYGISDRLTDENNTVTFADSVNTVSWGYHPVVKDVQVAKDGNSNWIFIIYFQTNITDLATVSITIEQGDHSFSLKEPEYSDYLNSASLAEEHKVYVGVQELLKAEDLTMEGDITIIVQDTAENPTYPNFTYTTSLSE